VYGVIRLQAHPLGRLTGIAEHWLVNGDLLNSTPLALHDTAKFVA
jgi:hypothetical protein